MSTLNSGKDHIATFSIYLCSESYVLLQIEVICIHVKVLENVFIVHEDWEFLGNWIIAVAGHLLTAVNRCGLHDARLSLGWFVRKVPQATLEIKL